METTRIGVYRGYIGVIVYIYIYVYIYIWGNLRESWVLS